MKLKIKYFHSDSIVLIGMPAAMSFIGHNVIDTRVRPHVNGLNYEEVSAVEDEIRNGGRPDLVFTYDFIPAVSVACDNLKVKYLAWVYDCPQMELYRPEVSSDFTYISVFDKKQYEHLKKLGHIRHLFYNPLAADIDLFQNTIITEEDMKNYSAEVSFLGRLYDKEYVRKMFSMCSLEDQARITEISSEAVCKWDRDHIHGQVSDEFVDRAFAITSLKHESNLSSVDFKRNVVENGFISPKCNELERKVMINFLARRFPITLYSGRMQYDELDKSIVLRDTQDYLSEMPKVFNISRINLNITSKSIESGIPQRVWDIMAVGGFCLTNYQPELEEYFDIGKDIAVYRDLAECENLIRYYLSHEEERMNIAVNGYMKVGQVGNSKDRVKKVLGEIAG